MGGHGGNLNAGLEPANGQGSLAAQSWDGGDNRRQSQPRQLDTYQAPQQAYPQQDPYSATAGGSPGASYERPDAGYDRPQQQQAYQPAPQRQRAYQPQPQPQQQDGYTDPTAGSSGPAGTSRPGQPAQRHDEVGYAGVRGVAGGDNGSVVMIHRSLPAGSFVEVTSLETGRTILMLVTGTMAGADHVADLSPAAARLLGSNSTMIPVRVRAITPTGQDQAALLAGQPAGERPDTPPVLLNPLRKQLPAFAAAAPAPNPGRPAAQPSRPATGPRGGAGYYVQVGAFSNQANANGLAQSLGGFVKPGGGLYRVQMGPYRTAGEAQAARADAARRGYGDAKVLTQN